MPNPNKVLSNTTLTGGSSAGIIYWDSVNQNWYVGGNDTSGNVLVSKYSKAYQLLQTQVIGTAAEDNHDVPSIIRMNSGQFLAVWNLHGGAQYSKLSTGADDIRSWGSAVTVTASTPGATFQFLFQGTDTNHTVFLVTSLATGVSNYQGWGYYTTTDGSTWSSFNWIYKPGRNGPILTIAQDPNTPNTIHWFMGTTLSACKIYHFYCVIQSDASLKWYKTDGTDITSTLGTAWTDESNWTPVYTAANNGVNFSCAVVSGSPVILYAKNTASGSNGTAIFTAEQARWNGSAWVPYTIGALDSASLDGGSYAGPDYIAHGSNVSGYPCQDSNDIDTVYLPVAYGASYTPALPSQETSGALTDMRLEAWKYNGSSWSKTADVSGNVGAQIVMGVTIQGVSPTQLLYTQGSYSGFTSFNLDLWAYPTLPLYATKPASPVWTAANAPLGTQAYYLLYESSAGSGATIHDVKGSYNGSVAGGLTVSSGTYGNELSGFSATQYVSGPSGLATDFMNSSFPRFVWVLAKSPSSGTSHTLFSFTNTGNSSYSFALILNSLSAGQANIFVNSNSATTTNSAANDGNYHLWLLVSTSATNHQLYIDGATSTYSTQSTATDVGNVNAFSLGALRRTTTTGPFAGSIVAAGVGWGSSPDPTYLAKDLLPGQFGGTQVRVATQSHLGAIYRSPFSGGIGDWLLGGIE
jgi:hypothetical protein